MREHVNEIDKQIVALFQERLSLCDDLVNQKMANGLRVQDKEYEKIKIEFLRSLTDNEFNEEGVTELYHQIMSISRKLQYQIMAEHGRVGTLPFELLPTIPKSKSRVVYQGVEGAYSQQAVFEYFGREISNFNVKTWDDAMKAVCGGMADYAVLPIENSTAGQVGDVLDLLIHYDNYIVGEIYLKIDHVLLGLPGATEAGVKKVYSHHQGLMQCSEYLNSHPSVEQISMDNTAAAAQFVKESGDASCAAIASEEAGRRYGLEVLNKSVTDLPDNTTRFIVVSSKKIYSESANKVSVCFETPHETGSLYRLLSHFIYNNLNMTKIESRPIPGKKWEYRIFVDVEGNLSSADMKNALRGILEEALYFKILGNY
ncbi:MAG: prephenate dehydratase [Clostridia bacterium]|nr:prephenate dehydratase [Clostridia bacterium]